MDENLRTVLCVESDLSGENYRVTADAGSSVEEMAFAVVVVIKSLIKAECVKSIDEFIDLIRKYYYDKQYEEITDESN